MKPLRASALIMKKPCFTQKPNAFPLRKTQKPKRQQHPHISTATPICDTIAPVNPSFDIVVVGAGIVGAACAAECAAGGLKVLVLDAGCIGGGVTACGMGHLV